MRFWIKGADVSKYLYFMFVLSVNDVFLYRQGDQLSLHAKRHSIPEYGIRVDPKIASLQDLGGGEIRLDFAETPPLAQLELFQKSNARLSLAVNKFRIDAQLRPIKGSFEFMGVTSALRTQ